MKHLACLALFAPHLAVKAMKPIFLSLIALCALIGFRSSTLAAERACNILFILADDMGWQDTSVAFAKERTVWNDRYHTPALERLAREGMKFLQAYSCTVCSPTRVSFITGQNEARHHVSNWTNAGGDKPSTDLPHPKLSYAAWNWNGLQPTPALEHSVSVPVLPALLKQAGYRTMQFGKGHFGAAGTPGADPKALLFDLAHDLGEKSNLAKAEPQRLREMAAELTSLLQQNLAPMPVVKATGLLVPWPLQGLTQP